MPRLVMLGERVIPNDPDRRPQGEWSITLERDGRFATMPVGEADLVGGVVIGRSEKCHSEALRRITHENTSRVHILILREGPEIVAYDLASTHGTFKDGLQVRRVSLGLSSVVILGSGPRAVRMIWSVAGR
jgi:hypothetical protein